jgi:dTDP-4-amino-4,6-dideoxygalactose transaminase
VNEEKELSLADPVLGEEEAEALRAVVASGWITMGGKVKEFEGAFAAIHGTRHGIAVSSATAGLHLVLQALGLGPGDEVLVPSLTFVASANAAWYTGGAPVLVDIESENCPHISLADAEAKLSPRTKAVLVMHYGGWPCPMQEWRAFANAHGLALLADAAHAPGLVDAVAGADAAVFSFYGNKNMTTAEGGMVLTGDEALAEQIRRLRSHGMTSLTWDRHAGHAFSYDVVDLGFNYRLDELRAALGLAQLERLPEWNKRRAKLLARYRQGFSAADRGITLPFPPDAPTAAHLCPVLLPAGTERPALMAALRAVGIHSSIHYPPIHQFSLYRDRFGAQRLPRTETFAARELSLPLHPGLELADIDRVVDEVTRYSKVTQGAP